MDTKEKSTLPATIGRTIFGLVVTAVLLLIICGGLHFMVKAAQNAGVCESIWQAVGYGFAALGCIAGVYIVLLVYYTKCCHTTGRKVFMVAMVIVMAFAVRFSLQMYAGVLEAAANAENGGVFDAGAGFIEALYGTFGGLRSSRAVAFLRGVSSRLHMLTAASPCSPRCSSTRRSACPWITP